MKVKVVWFFLVTLMASSPINAVTVTNPDDTVWSKIGWNLGWATGCNALSYSETMDPHRKVKSLRDQGLISEREFKDYTARRHEFLSSKSRGCDHTRVKRTVDRINRYLESVDK